ncbi:hypothetical protein TNIN_343311 [Trichonephila inaurata madagascariensis]|uniref:Uncharacterized protein n=1 Tax=Trichonephila inaurata madagascariensis TaxID=2747483 RepID=A0A8X6XB91_9ARAC|nr:hypothetical protein TNIN_343311 [Trichonephila inaurata madagascariensis]
MYMLSRAAYHAKQEIKTQLSLFDKIQKFRTRNARHPTDTTPHEDPHQLFPRKNTYTSNSVGTQTSNPNSPIEKEDSKSIPTPDAILVPWGGGTWRTPPFATQIRVNHSSQKRASERHL